MPIDLGPVATNEVNPTHRWAGQPPLYPYLPPSHDSPPQRQIKRDLCCRDRAKPMQFNRGNYRGREDRWGARGARRQKPPRPPPTSPRGRVISPPRDERSFGGTPIAYGVLCPSQFEPRYTQSAVSDRSITYSSLVLRLPTVGW